MLQSWLERYYADTEDEDSGNEEDRSDEQQANYEDRLEIVLEKIEEIKEEMDYMVNNIDDYELKLNKNKINRIYKFELFYFLPTSLPSILNNKIFDTQGHHNNNNNNFIVCVTPVKY